MNIQFEIRPAQAQQPLESTPYRFWNLPDGSVWTEFHRLQDGYLLRFPALADFRLSAAGRHVVGWPALGTSTATLEHLFRNQVHPLAMSGQGMLVMHASAVCVAGGGIAFLGESGRGKSTLATSLATAGLRCITDDGLVLENSLDGWKMIPGPGSVRLWEDARLALLSHGKAAEAVQYTSKGQYLADENLEFSSEPQGAVRFYFLGNGAASGISIQRLPPAKALMAMVQNTFLLESERAETLANHFDTLHELAALPIHFSLDYPRRYDYLGEVRDALIRHASNAASAP
jgi:hypothetical protein